MARMRALGSDPGGAFIHPAFAWPIRYDDGAYAGPASVRGGFEMSIDVQGLRSTIRNIKQEIARQQIVGLDEEIDRLERIADDAEHRSRNGADSATCDLNLPPEIVAPRPDAVNEYVRAHLELADLVRDMAAALVEEFRGERSQIELDLYQDPEIDDRYLTLIVRLPEYDDSLMPRIKAVTRPFDDRRAKTDGWILITSDYEPIE